MFVLAGGGKYKSFHEVNTNDLHEKSGLPTVSYHTDISRSKIIRPAKVIERREAKKANEAKMVKLNALKNKLAALNEEKEAIEAQIAELEK